MDDWKKEAKDSTLVKNWNPVIKRFRGDPKLAAAYLPYAQLILGDTIQRAKLGGIGYNSRIIKLADGTIIKAIVNNDIYCIDIDTSSALMRVKAFGYIPHFLYYPKNFFIGPYQYGWHYVNEGEDRTQREIPYLIDEPSTFGLLEAFGVFPSVPQNGCLLRQRYRYSDPTNSDENNLNDGLNPHYGNQFFWSPVHNTVFSFWASPFGDLPHLDYDELIEFLGTNRRYAPAYVLEVEMYVYHTEQYLLALPVPASLYRNGKLYADIPIESGKALISGIGFRENGDILLLVTSYSTIRLYVITENDEGNVKVTYMEDVFVSTGSSPANYVWHFSAGAERVGGLVWTLDENSTETLHSIEFLISPTGSGSYTTDQANKTPYYGTYKRVTNSTSQWSAGIVTESFVDADGLTHIRRTKYNKQTGDQVIETKHEVPLVAWYPDNSQSLQFITITRTVTKTTDYMDDGSTYTTTDPYWVYSGVGGSGPGDSQGGISGWRFLATDQRTDSSNNEIENEVVTTYRTTLDLGDGTGASVDLEDMTDTVLDDRLDRDTFLYSLTQYGFVLSDTNCSGAPIPTVLRRRSDVSQNYKTIYTHNYSRKWEGYDFQLLHVNARYRTITWIRYDYDIYKSGSVSNNVDDITLSEGYIATCPIGSVGNPSGPATYYDASTPTTIVGIEYEGLMPCRENTTGKFVFTCKASGLEHNSESDEVSLYDEDYNPSPITLSDTDKGSAEWLYIQTFWGFTLTSVDGNGGVTNPISPYANDSQTETEEYDVVAYNPTTHLEHVFLGSSSTCVDFSVYKDSGAWRSWLWSNKKEIDRLYYSANFAGYFTRPRYTFIYIYDGYEEYTPVEEHHLSTIFPWIEGYMPVTHCTWHPIGWGFTKFSREETK